MVSAEGGGRVEAAALGWEEGAGEGDQMGAGALSGWNLAGKKRRRGCGVFIELFLLPFSLYISPLSLAFNVVLYRWNCIILVGFGGSGLVS